MSEYSYVDNDLKQKNIANILPDNVGMAITFFSFAHQCL